MKYFTLLPLLSLFASFSTRALPANMESNENSKAVEITMSFFLGNCTDTLELGVQSANSFCGDSIALNELWENTNIPLSPGGTWTYPDGSVVPDGFVYIEVDPSGIYTYYFLNEDDCPTGISLLLNITPNGTALFPSNHIDVCLASPPFTPYDSLLGVPATLSGAWIYYDESDSLLLFANSGNSPMWTIDPADFNNQGNPMVDGYLGYYSDDFICGFSIDTLYIDVVEAFDAGQSTAASTICQGGGPVDLLSLLSGTPDPGGVWEDANGMSVPGILDPAALTPDSTYILTYSGGLSGSPCFSSQELQLSIVADSDPPAIACPENLQLTTNTTNCTAQGLYDPPTVSDSCSEVELNLDEGLAPGSDFPLGVNTVTYSASDSNGNSATCSFTIEVLDLDPPLISCQDISIELDQNGEAVITIDDIEGIATDACGIAEESLSQYVFTESDLGANTVTYTAIDNSGNEATCTAYVEVSSGTLSSSQADGAVAVMRLAPNPTDSRSFITFRLAHSGQVSLEIYDVSGRLLKRIFEGEVPQGLRSTFEADLSMYSDGLYICRLTTIDGSIQKKLVLNK